MAMSSASGLLAIWASVIWIAALAGVLVLHCGHLIHMCGQHRWYHLSHIVMLLGMLYMYASMAFLWGWIPSPVWMFIYLVTSLMIIGWMLTRIRRRRPLSYLWILALAQQSAMIYMCAPMRYWTPWFTYALAAYFSLETIGWLTGLCNDDKPRRGNAASWVSRSPAVPLVRRSAIDNISMMVMAASMAYMFAGMQLMMSTPSRSRQSAPEQPPAPPAEIAAPAPAIPPAVEPPIPPAAPAPPPANAEAQPTLGETYAIQAGDTLMGIAAKLYHNPQKWRDIAKANPGLDLRRLRAGRMIKLPRSVTR